MNVDALPAFAPPLEPHVDDGLRLLASSRPLWPVEAGRWQTIVDDVRTFATRWDARARALGWSDLALYGLSRSAPYANLAAMGAAFVAARGGHRVVAVASDWITMESAAGAQLRLLCGVADANSVLGWLLCSPAGLRSAS